MTSEAFTIAFKTVEKQLFSYAINLLRNHDKAQDLLQEVFALGFKNRERFIDGSNFKAWISTIMHNRFVTEYRKRKKRISREIPLQNTHNQVVGQRHLDHPEERLYYDDLLAVINQLPNNQKKPFLLYVEGYKYDEIAEQLNKPIGTIKGSIFYARKELQERLRGMNLS